uniref:Uncharacterized protein n=1 Tax=Anguilla anguilla TaxID=7936 RepID=A0A0E9PGA7_ANGAN
MIPFYPAVGIFKRNCEIRTRRPSRTLAIIAYAAPVAHYIW